MEIKTTILQESADKENEISLQAEFLYAMQTQGYYLFENAISENLLERLRQSIDQAFSNDQKALSAGHYKTDANISDVARLLLGRDKSFEMLIDESPIQEYVDLIIGNTCIINNYSAVRLMPKIKNVVANIHKDSPRHSPGYKLAVQVLYFIDDFTEQTGGTWLLPGSHNDSERPSESFFFKHGKQVTGKRGSVMVFDSSLWHAAGHNITNDPRRGIAIVYTRSFIKQQINISKALPQQVVEAFSEKVKRLIGYNVRVPNSLEEFYLPETERLYKGGQG